MGTLDPDDPCPPYLQIADHLRTDVRSRKLAPGAQLPTMQALANEYGVSLGTAKSALNVLREEGIVVTRQGKGSFVRTRMAHVSNETMSLALEELRQAVTDLTARVDAMERRSVGQ